MTRSRYAAAPLAAAVIFGGAALVAGDVHERYMQWEVHDPNRPKPPVVDPGYAGTQEKTGKAPSDAVVLFDGTSLDAFEKMGGGATPWEIVDGFLVVKPRSGNIVTKQAFGDMQLHVEWMVPGVAANRGGQDRGNSGIFLMNTYEVQVLDCKNNDTYADGVAGAVYGQHPPLANAGRGLDQWQSYDIIFRRPHFDDRGNVTKPATVTVLHNGVLVQDHTEILGPTLYMQRTAYKPHADALPLRFQDHGEPTHFRNIWVRELEPVED